MRKRGIIAINHFNLKQLVLLILCSTLILSFSDLFGSIQGENESFLSIFRDKAFREKFTIVIITALVTFLGSYTITTLAAPGHG